MSEDLIDKALSMNVRDGFHPGGAGIVGLDVDDGRPQVFKEPFNLFFCASNPATSPLAPQKKRTGRLASSPLKQLKGIHEG
jgi:hypothetical protein